eukprot:jgi/Chlat1/2164/Chrsp17S08746
MTEQLLLEEPVRLGSIVETPQRVPLPAFSKIVCTLGPATRSVQVLEALLKTGMTVARFDFSYGSHEYHQETLDNLREAMKNTRKLCAVMLDTRGPEITVTKNSDDVISVEKDQLLTLTSDLTQKASKDVLPLSYANLAQNVKVGTDMFLGQYLFTGHDTASVFLKVVKTTKTDVVCKCYNSANLGGSLLTLSVGKTNIDLPTLTKTDIEDIEQWGAVNGFDFLSLSFTRCAADVLAARQELNKRGDLKQAKILAKIENLEGLLHLNEILEVADGIILSRANLGIDLPAEKMFLAQKMIINRCNFAGKPVVITRVVDSMCDTPRPTRAEATDVANAILDGADAIMLGAETLRGSYPIETVETVLSICQESERVYNHQQHFKNIMKELKLPLSQLESLASSAVRCAEKIKASMIVCFTESGRAARLIAKYRPQIPIIAVVIPVLSTDQLMWHFTGEYQFGSGALESERHDAIPLQTVNDTGKRSDEYLLSIAIRHGMKMGIVALHDLVVVSQKLGDSAVVKIVQVEE